MSQFKVGDWVRNTKISRVFQYTSKDKQYDELHPTHALHDIPWVPEAGDWCLFYHKHTTSALLAKLNKFDPEYAHKYQSQESETWYQFCEPFTGTLPAQLKESDE